MSNSSNANSAAHEQAAMLRAALLLARCSSSSLSGPAAGSLQDQARSHCHAKRQADLLAWLDAGGFTQDNICSDAPTSAQAITEASPIAPADNAIENSGIAPLFSAPLRDSLRGIEILSTPHQRCS